MLKENFPFKSLPKQKKQQNNTVLMKLTFSEKRKRFSIYWQTKTKNSVQCF